MTSESGYESYHVVVVPFPFTDRASNKRRPALVLSEKLFNDVHSQLVLGMITTAAGGTWSSDVALADWKKAGLTTHCRFRMKLFTLDCTLIIKKVGKLTAKDTRAVRGTLQKYLAVT